MPVVRTLTQYQLIPNGRIFGAGSIVSLGATDYAALTPGDKGSKWDDYAGTYETVANTTTLPTAGAAFRGEFVYVKGDGATTADVLYVCLQSATGSYSWKSVATG